MPSMVAGRKWNYSTINYIEKYDCMAWFLFIELSFDGTMTCALGEQFSLTNPAFERMPIWLFLRTVNLTTALH